MRLVLALVIANVAGTLMALALIELVSLSLDYTTIPFDPRAYGFLLGGMALNIAAAIVLGDSR